MACLEIEMKVIWHQAIASHCNIEDSGEFPELFKKYLIIPGRKENLSPHVSAVNHMIACPGIFYSQRSRHLFNPPFFPSNTPCLRILSIVNRGSLTPMPLTTMPLDCFGVAFRVFGLCGRSESHPPQLRGNIFKGEFLPGED
jgi:hypothetical protein